MKKILFAASEAVPFIKTGGLADVVGSLPKAFNKEEFDVRVVLPKYRVIPEYFHQQMEYMTNFYINLAGRMIYVGVFQMVLDGVTFYFIDNEYYFSGDKIYEDGLWDLEKFAYFSKAALTMLCVIDFRPDIIHCHDWQTGLVPVYLHTAFGDDNFYAGIKTVFSIHNLKFQGRWRIREVIDITGLPEQIFNDKELESYGEANYLKGGVVYADAVTTVSPSYANEITTQEGGEGLHGLMNARRNVLYGILNGIDYDEFNPQTDPYIESNFSSKSVLSGKKANKAALQKELGLSVRESAFVIGIVSRLTEQKGFDLVSYIMDDLVSQLDVQIVILGTGESKFENVFHHFHSQYPDKVSAYIGYSEEKAHKIYASADAFLMPSLFEPCGLSQMMSMRYGTIPIVRETGGLKDTVQAYNEYENTGTGFSFCNFNADDMKYVVEYAYHVFRDERKAWEDMMQRAMAQDFSWNKSAGEYEKLYDSLCDMK